MNMILETVQYGWDRQPISAQRNTDVMEKEAWEQFIQWPMCKPCWKSAAFNG